MEEEKKTYDFKLFFIGLALLVLGVIALLATTGHLPMIHLLWPLAPVVLGFILLFIYSRRGHPKKYIYLGIFFILSGSFTQIILVINARVLLEMLWPLYLTFGGLSFIPYSMKKQPSSRMSYFVAALAMLFISFFFLLFSLNFFKMSFREFVKMWWPLLIVGMGLFLTVISYIRQKKDEEESAS